MEQSKEIVPIRQLIKDARFYGVKGEVILASESVKVYEIDPIDVQDKIQTLIKKTILESGQKFEPEDISALIFGVYKDIQNEFAYASIDELSIAYHQGVRGNYGEFYGLSIVTFYKWSKEFFKRKKDIITEHERSLPKLPEAPITTEQRIKIRKIFIDSVVDRWKKYLETDDFLLIDGGNVLYKTLDEMKLINVDKEIKWKLVDQARFDLIHQKKLETAGSKMEDAERDRLKADIIKIIQGSEMKFESEILSNSMTLTVREQFRQWKAEGSDVPFLLFEANKNYK